MQSAARIALPILLPRGFVLWGLVRLAVGLLPLAAGRPFGSVPPNPLAVVLLCGVVGLIDVQVRGERMLWANLGIAPAWLYSVAVAVAILAEWALALAIR